MGKQSNGNADPATTCAPGNGSTPLPRPEADLGSGEQPYTVVKHEVAAERVSKPHFLEKADEAISLLEYAAESGIEIGDDIRDGILEAANSANGQTDSQKAARFLSSFTKLAQKVEPVTARTLLESSKVSKARHAGRKNYFHLVLLLAVPTVFFSIAAFVSSGISDNIQRDTTNCNALVRKLNLELPPRASGANVNPAAQTRASADDVHQDLQVLAESIRSIDRRGHQLNHFLFLNTVDPLGTNRDDRELNWGMLQTNMAGEAEKRILKYQDVRNFASNAQEGIALWYGAAAKYVLPVLYALLGACAYLARRLEREVTSRTFNGDDKRQIRLVIAGIGGLVVGLFSNFSGSGASLPPLAVAFLVGYSVDVFFRFLENLTDALAKGSATPKQR